MRVDRSFWASVKNTAQLAGADVALQDGGKHMRIVLSKDGRSRFVVLGRTPSDHRMAKNCLMNVLQELANLNATLRA